MAPRINRFLGRWATVVLGVEATLGVIAAAPAAAHETRGSGPVRYVVGWSDEPAYTGFKNSVQITITEPTGAAVTDVGDALSVEVIKGNDKAMLPLQANFRVGAFGTPGDYRAWLTPTRPGSYTFHLTGILRGQKVDETFTSSKSTFNDVEDVTNIAFPAKDPSTGQLASRIDREVPRLDTALDKAADTADGARMFGLAGTVFGLLGLVAGGGALMVARRKGNVSDGPRDRPVSEMARPHT